MVTGYISSSRRSASRSRGASPTACASPNSCAPAVTLPERNCSNPRQIAGSAGPLLAHGRSGMRYLALCCDYDGTLATHGEAAARHGRSAGAARSPRAAGCVMVTGPRARRPAARVPAARPVRVRRRRERRPALPPGDARGEDARRARRPRSSSRRCSERGVDPMSVGRVIVATWEPHETVVLEAIRELGLELQVIFNKGAVMVLPAGVNKATGLARALEQLGLSPHNVVGVGDAENDHAFLRSCECAVAVANALPTLKEAADIVTARRPRRRRRRADRRDAGRRPRRRSSRACSGTTCSLGTTRRRRRGASCRRTARTCCSSAPPAAASRRSPPACSSGWPSRSYKFCVIDPEGRLRGLRGRRHARRRRRARRRVEEIVQVLAQARTRAAS